MSSLRASTTTPPVSSQRNSPAITTHHSSKSACQCGRLPPPGRLAIRVTRLRSSAMTRRDHGGGPIFSTSSETRVRRVLGPSALALVGGVGPVAKNGIVMVVVGMVPPAPLVDRLEHPVVVVRMLKAGDKRGRRKHARHHQDRKSTRLNSSHVSMSYSFSCSKI